MIAQRANRLHKLADPRRFFVLAALVLAALTTPARAVEELFDRLDTALTFSAAAGSAKSPTSTSNTTIRTPPVPKSGTACSAGVWRESLIGESLAGGFTRIWACNKAEREPTRNSCVGTHLRHVPEPADEQRHRSRRPRGVDAAAVAPERRNGTANHYKDRQRKWKATVP